MGIRTFLVRRGVRPEGTPSGAFTYSVSLGLDGSGRFELSQMEYYLEPHARETRKVSTFGGTYTETDELIVCSGETVVEEESATSASSSYERDHDTSRRENSYSLERRFVFKKMSPASIVCSLDFAGLMGGVMELGTSDAE